MGLDKPPEPGRPCTSTMTTECGLLFFFSILSKLYLLICPPLDQTIFLAHRVSRCFQYKLLDAVLLNAPVGCRLAQCTLLEEAVRTTLHLGSKFPSVPSSSTCVSQGMQVIWPPLVAKIYYNPIQGKDWPCWCFGLLKWNNLMFLKLVNGMHIYSPWPDTAKQLAFSVRTSMATLLSLIKRALKCVCVCLRFVFWVFFNKNNKPVLACSVQSFCTDQPLSSSSGVSCRLSKPLLLIGCPHRKLLSMGATLWARFRVPLLLPLAQTAEHRMH